MAATVTPPPTPVAAQLPEVTAYLGATRLTKARDIEYEEVQNDLGSWSMVMSNPAAAASGIDFGDLVTFKELGTTSFIGIVEEIVQVTVAGGEEAEQATTYSGRSVLAELDRAIVYGPVGLADWSGGYLDGLRLGRKPYADVRYWNYASPELDRSAWTTAIDFCAAGQTPPLWPPDGFIGAPSPWPYPFAQWIVPRAESGGAHPAGDWYTHNTVTTSGAFSYDLVAAGGTSDQVDIWWDGVLILHIDAKDALKPFKVNIAANDGTHDIVARIRHGGAGASGDITGFICAVFKHFDDGGGWVQAPLVYTSAAQGWVCADYPSVAPGFYVDEIIEALITEAQARDGDLLTGWAGSWDSGDHQDTRGENLPQIAEFSCRVGTKVIDALKSLAENYIEFGANWGTARQLDVWNIPGLDLRGGGTATGGGSASGVTLTPGVNVSELTHHATSPETTATLTRWDDGFLELLTDADDSRYEAFLSLADYTDGIQTFWNTARQMVNLSTAGESIDDLRHRLKAADQYAVRDTATIPNRAGTNATWRNTSRAVNTDADGNGFVTAGFGVPRDDTAARNDRWSRKVLGTMDGRSETATPSSPFILSSEQLTPVKIGFSTGGSGVSIVGDRGTPDRPDRPLLLVALEAEADIAGASGDNDTDVQMDGSSIGSITLPMGDTDARQVITPVLAQRANYLNVETTAAGGAQGMSLTIIAMAAT